MGVDFDIFLMNFFILLKYQKRATFGHWKGQKLLIFYGLFSTLYCNLFLLKCQNNVKSMLLFDSDTLNNKFPHAKFEKSIGMAGRFQATCTPMVPDSRLHF